MNEDLNIVEPFFSAAFGKAVAKTLIISVASSAGVLVGFVVVGFAVSEVQKRLKKKTVPATVTPTE